MANWLTKIRKKPKHIRDNIAFGSSAGLTLVVALAWFLQGGSTHLANKETVQRTSFFETFKEGFNKQMAAARESLPKSATTSVASTTAESGTVDMAATSSASSSDAKPVLIEIIKASSTASSSSSSSAY